MLSFGLFESVITPIQNQLNRNNPPKRNWIAPALAIASAGLLGYGGYKMLSNPVQQPGAVVPTTATTNTATTVQPSLPQVDTTTSSTQQTTSTQQPFYNETMMGDWNRFATQSGLPQMVGVKNDQEFIDQLNKHLNVFNTKPSPEYLKQLNDLSTRLRGPSSFNAYEDWKNQFRQSEPIHLTTNMTPQEIAHEVNRYAGVKVNGTIPDYIHPETLKRIGWMNSFKNYFNDNRDQLHDRGIDNAIDRPEDMSTQGLFPELDKMIEGGQ